MILISRANDLASRPSLRLFQRAQHAVRGEHAVIDHVHIVGRYALALLSQDPGQLVERECQPACGHGRAVPLDGDPAGREPPERCDRPAPTTDRPVVVSETPLTLDRGLLGV
ncbi:MAG TPA: hypothetical protein VMM79_02250 [Longimicrobiales bacterium]|nr:hypothetical protein [Longimicrobiales bacterium]